MKQQICCSEKGIEPIYKNLIEKAVQRMCEVLKLHPKKARYYFKRKVGRNYTDSVTFFHYYVNAMSTDKPSELAKIFDVPKSPKIKRVPAVPKSSAYCSKILIPLENYERQAS